GIGGARSLAGRHHLAITDGPVLFLRGDARGGDSLHTVRTFLHHTAAAHGYLRVAQQLERRCCEIAVLEEVEVTDLVWAVVRAIARADTAIVDHVIQPLRAVNGGTHRTHQLTWSGLTLHARHELLQDPRIVACALEIGVDSQPQHVASAADLLFANHRNVVLGLARNHT